VRWLDQERDRLATALQEAKKALPEDVPVGAAVYELASGRLLAVAHNCRERALRVSGHAELVALDRAAHRIGNWRLDGCGMYVTLQPCPMCAAAIGQARLDKLVFGAYDPDGASQELLASASGLQSIGGVLEVPCRKLLEEFFRERRARTSFEKIRPRSATL
jgi:tRNA(adenine34) deaminase